MPGTDGFSTLEELMQNWPNIRVIMLSASANAAEIKLARRLSSAGYLSKSTDRVTLVRAMRWTPFFGQDCVKLSYGAHGWGW
jgi:DNA-binding NarL/FixJ family response regulator